MTARRRGSSWIVTTEDSLTRGTRGDVQVLAIGRKGEKGRKVRIANVYSQGVFSEGQERPERNADWEGIFEADTALAGDFNAHSRRWNQHATTQRNQTFLEDLMDRHDLHVHNDDTATYWGDGDNNYSSIIDLTLTTPGVTGKIASWSVLEDDEHATGSDHEIIEWMVDLGAIAGERVAEVKGWAITELLADDNKTDEAKKEWQSQMAGRPMLSDTAEVDQLEEEVQHIQDSMVRVLDMHVRKIRLCARSKKW